MKNGDATPTFSKDWWGGKAPWVGFLVSICGAAGMVGLTLLKHPTPFEAGSLQLLILLTGLWGTYILGRKSALQAARDMIRPHARSAFRRVLALYDSLIRLSSRIEDMKANKSSSQLELVQALVDEQIRTGKDAIEDWKDIVPEEVAEIEKKYGKIIGEN